MLVTRRGGMASRAGHHSKHEKKLRTVLLAHEKLLLTRS